MSPESTLPEAYADNSEELEIALWRWQWIFPVLIMAGMILIGVSVLMLLRDAAGFNTSNPAAWIARL